MAHAGKWTHYRLLTRWRAYAPVAPLWHLIVHSENWPRWWQGVERVEERRQGDSNGVGNVRHYVWRSALGYRLSFDIESKRVEPMCLLEGAARGEVTGWGRWHFHATANATDVIYEWDVEVTHPTMRLLSPIGRPFFKMNHHLLMRHGAQGLARELKCTVECCALPATAEARQQ